MTVSMRLSFQEELARLEASLQEEGDFVLRALRSSLNALARGDAELADDGVATPLLALPDAREMNLDRRQRGDLERVADRV